MNTSLTYRAKSQAAKVIILGTLVLVSLGLAMQLVIIFLFYPSDKRVDANWAYVISMGVMCIGTYISLKWLNRSLKSALYLYITTATVNILTMTWGYFATLEVVDTLPFILFGLDIGVFILGLILGFRSALIYAGIVTLLGLTLGTQLYGLITDITPIIFFAYLMTLPSWLVDRLEKNLIQSEQKFSLVFQDSLDVIIIIEKATGIILNVNRAATEILHYDVQHLIGRDLSMLFPPDASLGADVLLKKLTTQHAVFDSQPVLRADCTTCPMDLTATNMQWGTQAAVLLTLRDITERQQAEQEIQRYREHLEDLVAQRTATLQARNEELDAFAHTVAHDLKNPLSTLIGFGELLTRRFQTMDPEQRAYAFLAITQMGRKMTNIIDELLLLSTSVK